VLVQLCAKVFSTTVVLLKILFHSKRLLERVSKGVVLEYMLILKDLRFIKLYTLRIKDPFLGPQPLSALPSMLGHQIARGEFLE